MYILYIMKLKKNSLLNQYLSVFCRIVCDSWLELKFPIPDSGQILLMKATKLRHKWDFLLNQQLQGIK